ncbi:LptF/LptG family permease [Danxiaibacter flavus]|uniref:LptF/LptG family permease n=1 Tax=Danxiaibacter flavus TaxID=3049108 RepID=A0ABV3ZDH7_9BACT|nr:LptF/LptG family permease [Chitinophagaceae bacterium DXS]
MIKKLDSLIIRSFIGPFFATFLISLFVLVMQFFWLYIDDLIGKGLDILTILQLISYVAVTAVPLALPLALLLSSIMTFGNLGETFELVAIKSAGIPLLRFMRPLLIVAIFISGLAFLFTNNIIPVAQLKLNSLKYDIIVAKPAFDIKEGVFYDKIEGFVIKLGKKDKDDSTVHNVIIYEKNYGLQDDILMAESGIMRVTKDKRFLEFILRNGWRYSEEGNRYSTMTRFTRMGFKQYKKVLDLSSFKLTRTKDSLYYDPKMLSVRQLNHSIDSLQNLDTIFYKRTEKELKPYIAFLRVRDSSWKKIDTVAIQKAASFDKVIGDSFLTAATGKVLSELNSTKTNLELINNDYKTRKQSLNKHKIEWHRKFTLSVACLVLFMIGAPLGSIIRKGGLGTPLVFAIVFFVLFHLLNTFGEKFAKEEVTSPMTGMWLSTAVLIPIGVFLTSKAMRDSQLFNKEFYHRSFKTVRKFFLRFKKTEEVSA